MREHRLRRSGGSEDLAQGRQQGGDIFLPDAAPEWKEPGIGRRAPGIRDSLGLCTLRLWLGRHGPTLERV
ncbi:hypothetical protein GCM10023169_07720 [Georgenia halophila]|uniref:Uncharacterized protein n=1 Tax=Georgenia halophila TaxID=620889 RepID=A0ABP8KYR4_9MICO